MATPAREAVKLGVAYNVFDCEELLQPSVMCVRGLAKHVVVVYQRRSNFDEACHPRLLPFLQYLQQQGLVDELVEYEPRPHSLADRQAMICPHAGEAALGTTPDRVGAQYFHEVSKRELGRQRCLAAGCTHFMSMDADEMYFEDELEAALQQIHQYDYPATACRMRIFIKSPEYELLPPDPINCVPLVFQLDHEWPIRLGCTTWDHTQTGAMADPTRRLCWHDEDRPVRPHVFDRHDIEMYHYSLVRRDLARKLRNVSNRHNLAATQTFLDALPSWKPEDGVIHPHPVMIKFFKAIGRIPNVFNIHFDMLCAECAVPHAFVCARCGPDVPQARYCSKGCQERAWPRHRAVCGKAR